MKSLLLFLSCVCLATFIAFSIDTSSATFRIASKLSFSPVKSANKSLTSLSRIKGVVVVRDAIVEPPFLCSANSRCNTAFSHFNNSSSLHNKLSVSSFFFLLLSLIYITKILALYYFPVPEVLIRLIILNCRTSCIISVFITCEKCRLNGANRVINSFLKPVINNPSFLKNCLNGVFQ